jgi:hypothetical protein
MFRLTLFLAFVFIVGCSQATQPQKKETNDKYIEKVPIRRIQQRTEYYGYSNGQNCWSNTETLNCKLKKAHTLIDRLNSSLESLDGAVGGCCNKQY